ncbi:hypothetical protein [Endozoicomonas sp. GU-1]|nr:hypothetical protein [Endozoicomonas sp. GU-1]WBA80346.1 hypothetical protein O2T12_18670 [Endozoicomonas sp. GU-1]
MHALTALALIKSFYLLLITFKPFGDALQVENVGCRARGFDQ